MSAQLAAAIRCHQQGELRAAERQYREILAREPRQVDALHLLGVLAQQTGRAAEAIELLSRASSLAPHAAIVQYHLGQTYSASGQFPTAVEAYRRAIALDATLLEAWQNLGVALERSGDLAAAVDCMTQACALRPESADVRANLAELQLRRGDIEAALASAREAVRLMPTSAGAANRLALALRAAGQHAEAEGVWRFALRHDPRHLPCWNNLGRLLHDLERFDEAIVAFEQALQIEPNSYETLVNLGAALKDCERGEEAGAALARATQLAPQRAEAWLDLGKVHEELGELSLALRFYERAQSLAPENAEIRLNRALVHLQLGEFTRGWQEYDARWQTAGAPERPPIDLPEWQGEWKPGLRLLVFGEQGIGDEIMFASCVPGLIVAGVRVTLVAEPRLAPLFARSFPLAEVIPTPNDAQGWKTIAAGCDAQIPVGSLPRYLRASASQFPRRAKYLRADAQATARWREHYRELGPGMKIGISWRAGTTAKTRRHRNPPLAAWRSLAAIAGAQFICLQYGASDDELAELRAIGLNVRAFSESDPLRDLDDFAAQIAALDLVVSIGNATVHLAGALGVPCWNLLPCHWGWRWGIDRADSPWYASIRLFRQSRTGDWDGLFARVAGELAIRARAA